MAERTKRSGEAAGLPESGTVTVACKLPNGLILQLSYAEDVSEPVMGGGVKVSKRYRKGGQQVTLHPARVPFGEIPEYKVIGGYSITEGVDAQFFAEWLNQNEDSELVKNKLIFAYERDTTVAAVARENRGVKSGLEPVNPGRDDRMPKQIKPADRTDKDMVA